MNGFAGINISIPSVSNSPFSMSGDIGFQGGANFQVLPNIDVKLTTLPEHSGGFIDFARVCHSKYMVVDAEKTWIGTSNWSGDYFYQSRNVGLIVEGVSFGKALDDYFVRGWTSEYAYSVDPCKEYTPPRRQ